MSVTCVMCTKFLDNQSLPLSTPSTSVTPTFIKQLCDVEVKVDDGVVLHCQSTSNHEPHVVWMFNYYYLRLPNERMNVKNDAGDGSFSLIIHHANLNDQGTYLCRITNEFGTQTTRAL